MRFNENGGLEEPDIVPFHFGLHPKENEVHWLGFHNACFTNYKLAKMNLIESSLCPICSEIQTAEHIFMHCLNATLIWKILKDDYNQTYDDSEFKFGSKDVIKNKILLPTKRTLFLNKDAKIDKKFIYFCIDNRLADIKVIDCNKQIKISAPDSPSFKKGLMYLSNSILTS